MAGVEDQEHHWQIVNRGDGIVSSTPEGLWAQAVGYFEWCDMHPLVAKRTLTSGKEAGKIIRIESIRPYTVDGLCLHCGIDYAYISSLRSMKSADSPFAMVMDKIITVIKTQNIEFAIAGEFNAIFTGKVLNLDKPEDTVNAIQVQIVNGTPALCDDESVNAENSNFGKSDQNNETK